PRLRIDGQLVIDGERHRPDVDLIARLDVLDGGDPAAVEEGAVDAVQVLDGDQAVFYRQPAVAAADLGRRDADGVAVGAAHDRFGRLQVHHAPPGPLLDDQSDVHSF